jgi:hypothetical protein
MGLEAAMTEHRACRDVTIPAFEIDIDCCSMASWIDVRSRSFICKIKPSSLFLDKHVLQNTLSNSRLIQLDRHFNTATLSKKRNITAAACVDVYVIHMILDSTEGWS